MHSMTPGKQNVTMASPKDEVELTFLVPIVTNMNFLVMISICNAKRNGFMRNHKMITLEKML